MSADPRDGMRRQFIEIISAVSEDLWCAGWDSGIVETLMAEGGLWSAMASECGGWPLGYRAEEGWGWPE